MIPDGVKIVYVSREIERALGFPLGASYHIVSNATAYGDSIKIQHPEAVTLIKTSPATLLGTTDLLNRPETSALITPGARLLVFKNTVRVESAAIANRWKLLNPPAALSERIENKLSQIRWLGPLAQKYLPPHAMKVAKYITMKNPEPFILQWAHGHTGDGTMLIRDADELRAIQAKFPERMARVTAYVDGPSFTVNAAVAGDRILIGNVSYQITGLEPFTDNRLSTVGNDWGLACQLLSDNDRQAIETMVSDIGRKLMMDGWKGLFGVDLIKDQARGRLYLIEINARQPASVPFESSLQESARENSGTRDLTIFEAHLAALL
ncbi:MAG: ATP-grasp domain-containing protein, partial [Patescibacteria group bacterium]|nr:ATP-grasp domain-containing protein [Patescibacteria group bacterium]